MAATARVIGFVLLLVAATVMYGWLARAPVVLGLVPGPPMVFNTAVCFAVAAGALLAGDLAPALQQRVRTTLGTLIIVWAGLVLSQYLLPASYGIDWPALHDWLPDANPFPGRMAAITCIGFLLGGLAFVLAPRAYEAGAAVIVHGLTLGMALIGAVSLLGFLGNFDALFDVSLFDQVSLPTAVGFILLAAGLWASWRAAGRGFRQRLKREDSRIIFTLILVAIALAAAAAAFVATVRTAEEIIGKSLAHALRSRVTLFTTVINHGIAQVELVATRPQLIRLFNRLAKNANDLESQELLPVAAKSFVDAGLSGIAFLDRAGREVARAGAFVAASELRLPLAFDKDATLLWDGQFVLHAEFDVLHEGAPVGRVVAESRLHGIRDFLSDVSDVGGSAELAVCGPTGEMMLCAPTRFHPRPATYSKTVSGFPEAMGHALAGLSGVIRTRDPRGKDTIAAYGSGRGLRIGMVLKADAADLFGPIRLQFQYLAGVTLVLLFGGVLWLRAGVKPLARKLLLREQQLALALQGSQLALWDWDVPTGRMYLSEYWQSMLGAPPGPTWTTLTELEKLVYPDDLPQLEQHLQEVLTGQATQYNVEHRVKTRRGGWLWIHSTGQVVERDGRGRALRLTGTNVDISRRKESEHELLYRASHDALTGLPNRSLFYDRLARAIARVQRSRNLIAVMYLDIDKFKHINDTLGHDAGDALLQAFAQRLTTCVRSIDTVARLEGDEFAIILDTLATRDAGCNIAGKIVATVQPEFKLGHQTLNITTSVGIAFYQGEEIILTDDLVKKADKALYAAKSAGRNNYQVAV